MKRSLVLVLVPALFVGCGDDSSTESAALVTYNIGLATGFVDYAPQRRPLVAQLVAGLDADLVCLQEVWSQEDVDAVLAAASGAFPHHYQVMLEDTSVGPPACTPTETDPLVACVDERCAETPASELGGCVLTFCEAEFGALSGECAGCAVANLGQEVDEIIATCSTSSRRYVYGGANGLLLLSRHPLSDLVHEKLESTNAQRSLLGVRVTLPVLGETAVVCTHLAADLTATGVRYSGPFGSWAGENRHHAEAAVALAEAYAGVKHRVILGDMNSGPANAEAGLVGEIPSAGYKVFVDAGYVDFPPAAGGAVATACTYCEDNTLISGAADVQIDRVLLSAVPAGATVSAELVGTEMVSIEVGGDAVETHPSDHYGVRVVLERR